MSPALLVSFKIILLWTARSSSNAFWCNKTKQNSWHIPYLVAHGTLWLLSWSKDTLVKLPSLLTSVAITTMSHQIRSWIYANPHNTSRLKCITSEGNSLSLILPGKLMVGRQSFHVWARSIFRVISLLVSARVFHRMEPIIFQLCGIYHYCQGIWHRYICL